MTPCPSGVHVNRSWVNPRVQAELLVARRNGKEGSSGFISVGEIKPRIQLASIHTYAFAENVYGKGKRIVASIKDRLCKRSN